MGRLSNGPGTSRLAVLFSRVTSWHLLAFGVVCEVAYYLAPGAAGRHAVSVPIMGGSALVVLIGSARFAPAARRAWTVLAASIFAVAIGESIWTYLLLQGERAQMPAAVAACLLAGFIASSAGMLQMAVARWSRRVLLDLLDVAIVALGGALLWWGFVVAPTLEDGHPSHLAFFSVMLPGLSLAMVWVVVRYLARPRPTAPATWLLLIGMALSAAGNASSAVVGEAMTSEVVWYGGVFPLAAIVIASAALHPTMICLTAPVPAPEPNPVWLRVVRIGFAVTVTVIALDLVPTEKQVIHWAGTATLLALLLVRQALLMRDNERQLGNTLRLEGRHRSVLHALEEAVILQDDQGRVIDANPAAGSLLNVPLAVVTGHGNLPAAELIRSDGSPLPDDERPGRVALRTGIIQSRTEFGIRQTDGSVRWFEANAVPLAPDDVNPEGSVVSSVRDVTENRLAAVRLAVAKGEAEEAARAADDANHAKSEFLSRVSHELRTPMNAVLGFGQLLDMDDLDGDQHDSVNQILTAGRHLLGLIDEVLQISSIESGNMAMSIEPVLVSDVVTAAVDLTLTAATIAGIEIQIATGPLGEGFVSADRQRLVQVLVNVLSNAVKYNRPEGRISITYAQPSDPNRFRILVTDTGAGIAPELLERVFVPFDRLGAKSSTVDGTGIGLSLSRGLVEQMGGHMGVHSTPGLGSTFWIELESTNGPASLEIREQRPDATETDARAALTILYVEDNLSNLRLIERVVGARPNMTLISAMQGRVGIDLATQHLPDLILLDVHLPDIDGDQVLRELRANPATASIPVAIISADATPRQIKRLRDAGADHYLTKPFNLVELLAIIDAAAPIASKSA